MGFFWSAPSNLAFLRHLFSAGLCLFLESPQAKYAAISSRQMSFRWQAGSQMSALEKSGAFCSSLVGGFFPADLNATFHLCCRNRREFLWHFSPWSLAETQLWHLQGTEQREFLLWSWILKRAEFSFWRSLPLQVFQLLSSSCTGIRGAALSSLIRWCWAA